MPLHLIALSIVVSIMPLFNVYTQTSYKIIMILQYMLSYAIFNNSELRTEQLSKCCLQNVTFGTPKFYCVCYCGILQWHSIVIYYTIYSVTVAYYSVYSVTVVYYSVYSVTVVYYSVYNVTVAYYGVYIASLWRTTVCIVSLWHITVIISRVPELQLLSVQGFVCS